MKTMKTYQKILLIVVAVIVAIFLIIYLGTTGILGWDIFNVLTPVEVPYGNWECTEPNYIYLEINDGDENEGYMLQDGEKINVYFTYLPNGDDCEVATSHYSYEDGSVISGDFKLSKDKDTFTITSHTTEEELIFHRVE